MSILTPPSSPTNSQTARTSGPHLLVTECANAVKAIGATIWRIEKFDFGILLRAEIGPKKFRIVVPPPGQQSPVSVPEERNSHLHVVQNMDSLRVWLQSLSTPCSSPVIL